MSYPEDENSVEAVQQLCGNLFSAMLVPICERAASKDWDILPGLTPGEDIRGDTVVLMVSAVLAESSATAHASDPP